MNSYQHKRDMHHAAPFEIFAGLEPSQALKTYTLTHVREHGYDTAFTTNFVSWKQQENM